MRDLGRSEGMPEWVDVSRSYMVQGGFLVVRGVNSEGV